MAGGVAQAVRSRLGMALCHPAVGAVLRRITGGVVHRAGLQLDVGAPAVSDANVARVFWGIYERTEIECVRRFLPRNLDVVELGASLGIVSAHIADVVDPARTLVCVEANPGLADLVRANAARPPGRRLVVVNAAVHYGGDRIAFRIDPGNLGSSVAEAPSPSGAIVVPAVTLGALVRDNGIGRFSLVCDIEGAEAGVLAHEQDLLRSRCRALIIELHDGRGFSVAGSLALIERLGFRLDYRRNDVFAFANPALVE